MDSPAVHRVCSDSWITREGGLNCFAASLLVTRLVAAGCYRAVLERTFAVRCRAAAAIGREADIKRLAMAAGNLTATNSSDG